MSEEQLTRFIAERQNEQDEFETFTGDEHDNGNED